MSPPPIAAAVEPDPIPPELRRIVVALARQAARDDYRAAKAQAEAERERRR